MHDPAPTKTNATTGPDHGPERRPDHGPDHGPDHEADHGADHGADDGPDHGPDHGRDFAPDIGPGLFALPDIAAQARMVEALLFASARPMTLRDLSARLPHGSDPAEALVLLGRLYAGRGVALDRVAGAWAFRTAGDLGFLSRPDAVEPRKLSRAATETLAIIAYHQPVTRAEIEEIRGVTVSRGTVDQLLDMGWIRFGRRKMTPGRPMTFVVTDAFLEHFGLESAADLPGLKDLRAAGLLDNRPPPGGAFSLGPEDAAPDDPADGGPDPDQNDMFVD